MLSVLRAVVPPTGRVIAAIADDQWSRPTPCVEMTERMLEQRSAPGVADVVYPMPWGDTSGIDRLAAFLGRNPRDWSAS